MEPILVGVDNLALIDQHAIPGELFGMDSTLITFYDHAVQLRPACGAMNSLEDGVSLV